MLLLLLSLFLLLLSFTLGDVAYEEYIIHHNKPFCAIIVSQQSAAVLVFIWWKCAVLLLLGLRANRYVAFGFSHLLPEAPDGWLSKGLVQMFCTLNSLNIVYYLPLGEDNTSLSPHNGLGEE